MTPLMLRQLWTLVDDIQSSTLLNLDDATLIQMLLREFREERSLNSRDSDQVCDYIRTRIPLIRDMAQQR